ncbi:hypothetical protein MRB53_040948 [Persea americana]|nr:hypothetical protein MRB53_040948 [Persea americana]
MADKGALTVQKQSKTPYQLDITQTTKAIAALQNHITANAAPSSTKPNLLTADDDDDDDDASSSAESTPIWLILTTKTHMTDARRLKPSSIPLPHPPQLPASATICLLTADPQRTFKDAIAHPSFPADLRPRITRVVGISKLKTKHSTYEARRKLAAEHDIFLADDRLIPLLPKLLGKVFYKSTTKRPLPITLAAPPRDPTTGKRLKTPNLTNGLTKKPSSTSTSVPLPPASIASAITKAVGATYIHLSPSSTTAIRIGTAAQPAADLSANAAAVMAVATSKFVSNGWRNVRAVHVKGPSTMSLPIWLASELWVDEAAVSEAPVVLFGNKGGKATKGAKDKTQSQQALAGEGVQKRIEAAGASAEAINGVATAEQGTAKKRKAPKAAKDDKEDAERHAKKKRKAEAGAAVLAAETALRREKARRRKEEVMGAVGQVV